MDVTTAARFHFLEIATGGVLRLPLLFVIGVSPPTLLAYETTLLLVSMLHHSTISFGGYDRWLRILIATPRMHSIHHSRDPRHFGTNFSSVFSVWDRLFATHQLTERPISHGLAGRDEQSLAQLMKMPFARESDRVD